MGTWYNDAPQEFREWMHTRFNAHDAPPSQQQVFDMQIAWEQGNAKGKGVFDDKTI
jgi:hypothetical protein